MGFYTNLKRQADEALAKRERDQAAKLEDEKRRKEQKRLEDELEVELAIRRAKEAREARLAELLAKPLVFEKHTELLCELIETHRVVIASVAWITSPRIIESLRKPELVSLIVSDARENRVLRGFAHERRDRHMRHDCGLNEPFADPVRVFGHLTRDGMMHHKFALFGFAGNNYGDTLFSAQLGWFGSFNWTHGATKNEESALLLKGDSLATTQLWYHHLALYRKSVSLID